jgi:DNA-binding FadR family transcriptional regulator
MTLVGPSKSKLAERVAAELETEILRRGWPVGELIGSETALVQKHCVSRSVFREAVRLLEHQSVARMRKGPGGGLVVDAPSTVAVSRAMAQYLRFAGVDSSQLLEARASIEAAMLQLASRNLNDARISKLNAYLAAEPRQLAVNKRHSHGFHLLLAELSGNIAIDLFVSCLVSLTEVQTAIALPSSMPQEVHTAHVRIADALVGGNVDMAQRWMARHLKAIAPYLSAAARAER